MAEIHAVCLSAAKGTVKTPVAAAEARADHGLVGDAHAGPGERQVSLLAWESVERMRALYAEIGDGDFGENLVTRGLDWTGAAPGERVRVGATALLEITRIGKDCHQGCVIRERTGDCIMPREGVFCRVLRGGPVKPGDPVVREGGTDPCST